LLCEAFSEKTTEQEQLEWERVRFSTWHLVNIQLDRKNKLRTPQKLIRFAWEKVKKKKMTDREKYVMNKL